MIILDTDHISYLQWGGPEGRAISRRLDEAGLAEPITTIVSYEEQMRGWLGKIHGAEKLVDEVRFYGKLQEQFEFYKRLVVLDFSEKAAVELQRLRAMRIRVATMDLKIAAIALANDATLWSRNLRHFSKVPGLRVEDATV
ncbi:MAG TPA: type II toxin-antitoxin system VapC family toxin [Phycisphaerae bacterium]|nr:type II toxin-antitoxin system VapC family toxin [Phycisphaerae bacterium]